MKACALAVATAIATLLLKEIGWRGAPLVGIVAALGLVTLILPYFTTLGSVFESISAEFEISALTKSVLKVLGIGYLGGISADVCSGLGERSAASAVNLVARIEILLITAPYFVEVVEMGVSLLES